MIWYKCPLCRALHAYETPPKLQDEDELMKALAALPGTDPQKAGKNKKTADWKAYQRQYQRRRRAALRAAKEERHNEQVPGNHER